LHGVHCYLQAVRTTCCHFTVTRCIIHCYIRDTVFILNARSAVQLSTHARHCLLPRSRVDSQKTTHGSHQFHIEIPKAYNSTQTDPSYKKSSARARLTPRGPSSVPVSAAGLPARYLTLLARSSSYERRMVSISIVYLTGYVREKS
jgi:hypothetical protein